MKQITRDFLKNIAIITAGSLMLPKILRANTTSTITVHAPELEGEKYTGSLVQIYDAGTNVLLGQSTTINSEATIIFTPTGIREQNDTSGLLSKLEAVDNGGSVIVSYPVHKESKLSIGLYDVLGRKIEERTDVQTKGNHQYQFKTKNLASGHYFFRVQTPEYLGTMDLPIMERQLAVPKGFSPQSRVVSFESKKKIDRLDKISSGDYKIVISNSAAHYTRIIITPSVDRLENRVTGYMSQNGVTPQIFKTFCKEMNFDAMPKLAIQGHNAEGLKTFLQTPNKVLWITFRNPAGMVLQSAANEAYVKNLLSTRFLPSISSANQPAIYVVDPQNPENPPTDRNGKLIIQPTSGIYSNMGVTSFNKDGIINTGVIQFAGGDVSNPSTWADSAYDQLKIRFLTQAICAPQEMTNPQYDNLTILSVTAPTANHSAMDKKLIKIAEYYKPKSAIDDILGI